jgi:guanine nucleotide-binding protein subunit alpha
MQPETLRNSLTLFENMCKTEWFIETPVMLLFTKFDIFIEQIGLVDLKDIFPDFKGQASFKDAIPFVTNKFLDIRGKDRIWTHYCRLDDDIESLVNNIGGSVKDIMYVKRKDSANIDGPPAKVIMQMQDGTDDPRTKDRFFKGLKRMTMSFKK